MQAKGMKSKLLLGFEDSYNTMATTWQNMPFNENSLASSQSLIESNTITGTRNPMQPALGQIDVSGSITIPLDVRSIGYWLKAVFGAPTTTAKTPAAGETPAKGPYTHVFKIRDSQPSISIEKGFGDINKYEQYSGVKVSKISFDAEVGNNETTVQMDLLGCDEVTANTSAKADAVMLPMLRFNNFNASCKQGGKVMGVARKMTIDLDCGLDNDSYVLNGKGTRIDIPEGIIKVSGSLTTLFTDLDLLNLAINGTETSLELLYTIGDYSLSILIPEVQLERKSPSITGPKGVTLETTFNGFYGDDAQKSAIVVTLVNDVETY